MHMLQPDGFEQSELGNLLVQCARSIVQVQRELDSTAARQSTGYVDSPSGAFGLPPIWYTIEKSEIYLELSAQIASSGLQPRLTCRAASPSMVALYGYQASATMKIGLTISPILPAGNPSVREE
jgi:hypothetical protein